MNKAQLQVALATDWKKVKVTKGTGVVYNVQGQRKFELYLMGLPKQLTNWRAGWQARSREAQKWKVSVVSAFAKVLPDTPIGKAIVYLERHSSVCPDYDGLVTSFKHVLDGFTVAGILKDDSMAVIQKRDYKWHKAKRNKGFVRVSIVEVVNEDWECG